MSESCRSQESLLKTILYATDLGIYGSYLLEHVVELASKHQAAVVVVHAVEPLSPFADAVLEAYVPEELRASLRSKGLDEVMAIIRERVLSAFQDDFIDFERECNFIRDVRVIAGPAPEVILKEAQRQQADLIVMGAKSCQQQALVSTRLGSVTSKVLQLSNVPVYMIPTETQGTFP